MKPSKSRCEKIPNPELDSIFILDWDRIRLSQLSIMKGRHKTHGTVVNEDIWEQWIENFYNKFPEFNELSSEFKLAIRMAMPTTIAMSNPNSLDFVPPEEVNFYHFLIGLRFSLVMGKSMPVALNSIDSKFISFFHYWDVFYTEKSLALKEVRKNTY